MFIIEKKMENATKYMRYVLDEVEFYCDGIFFIKGCESGIDSIKEFAKRYCVDGVLDFLECFGAYNFFIKENEKIIFFTDNSNLRTFLYNDLILSDNYYEFVKLSKKIEENTEGVYQFLLYGKNLGNKTYIKNCYKTESDKYYVLENKKISVCDKKIGDLNSSELGITPDEFGNIMRFSLKNLNKSLSLTGGFDSRYVMALLYGDDNLITSISCTSSDLSDNLIAQKVADSIDVKFDAIKITKPQLTEEKLLRMVFERKCFPLVISDSIFRLNDYIDMLKKRNIECILTGDTGIFHKSEDWYQDFPFYKKNRCNIEGYYKKRLINIKQDIPFAKEMLKKNINDKDIVIEKLSQSEQVINTKSYDWYGWYFDRGRIYPDVFSSQSILLNTYAPLMEYRFVINSYNLPRKERVMGRYMKKYITKRIPRAAKIPTATGVTTSCDKKYWLRDLFFSFTTLSKAALRLFGKKIFKRTFFSESAMSWSMEKEIRALSITERAIEFAKKRKWIDNRCEKNKINYGLLCKLIELYIVLSNENEFKV